MFQEITSLFPTTTHPITIVSDPDSLLTDETILAVLNERGFTLLTESDPVLLRNHIECLKPWNVQKPVIIITTKSLNTLPYDLWQAGHRLQLSLHDTFPNLAYPLVQALTPYQRARLKDCPRHRSVWDSNVVLNISSGMSSICPWNIWTSPVA